MCVLGGGGVGACGEVDDNGDERSWLKHWWQLWKTGG